MGMLNRKASAMSDVGVDIRVDIRRYLLRRLPMTIVTTAGHNPRQ
jgi:hypothetical protein